MIIIPIARHQLLRIIGWTRNTSLVHTPVHQSPDARIRCERITASWTSVIWGITLRYVLHPVFIPKFHATLSQLRSVVRTRSEAWGYRMGWMWSPQQGWYTSIDSVNRTKRQNSSGNIHHGVQKLPTIWRFTIEILCIPWITRCSQILNRIAIIAFTV